MSNPLGYVSTRSNRKCFMLAYARRASSFGPMLLAYLQLGVSLIAIKKRGSPLVNSILIESSYDIKIK